MKLSNNQQVFIDKLFILIKENNLCIEYNQTFKKKIMLQELKNKFSTSKTNFEYDLWLSCRKKNDGYMSENIMFSEELINDEIVDEIKTLFNVGNVNVNSKNISFVLCIFKKMKINSNFVGFLNKKYNRIYAKFCIDGDKSLYDYSIFGL